MPKTPVLTIRQPFIEQHLSGQSIIENRLINFNYRGKLLLHSAATRDSSAEGKGKTGAILGHVLLLDVISRCRNDGKVRGPAEIMDDIEAIYEKSKIKLPNSFSEDTFYDQWNHQFEFWWIFATPKKIIPKPMKGKQGIWYVSDTR